MQRLVHIPLPALTRYNHASAIQNYLVRTLLSSKADPSLPTPPPTILTAQFHPIYTIGRRDNGKLSPDEIEYLKDGGRAEVAETQRGGQTTFHGPGQLVAYPIIDLKRHGLSARCYVSLLEDVLINTCKRYGVEAFRTENTGVWASQTDKIAAIGVHLRRNVTSHGIGLNCSTDLSFFDRIVACGLEDKRATSLQKEGATDVGAENVGATFAKELSTALDGVDSVEILREGEFDNGMVEAMAPLLNDWRGEEEFWNSYGATSSKLVSP
jgi:lipoate-protein ligase B